MEISMEDFFYGFVRNYHSFRLEYNPPWTTWTNKILNYFDRLGIMLGARVKYEWHKYDLTWFRKGSNEVWLHIEHENNTGWEELKDTLKKINESECDNVITILYPASQGLWDKFVKKVEQSQKSWTDTTEVLTILDASDFQNENPPVRLEGYLFSNIQENTIYKAVKYEEEKSDIYYSILL